MENGDLTYAQSYYKLAADCAHATVVEVGNSPITLTIPEVVPDAVEFEGGPHLHPIW